MSEPASIRALLDRKAQLERAIVNFEPETMEIADRLASINKEIAKMRADIVEIDDGIEFIRRGN